MASNPIDDITYINARCHCAANKFRIPFLTSKLPIASDLCHCNSCRHVTGATAVHCAQMHGAPLSTEGRPDGQDKPADLSQLSRYNVSPHITRYFCKHCGAYILYETAERVEPPNYPHWSISSGALERTEGIVKVGYHAFVGDTLDGGLANHYRIQDGVEIPRFEKEENGNTLPFGWVDDRIAEKAKATQSDETLAAYCHCRAVTLLLKRAKATPQPKEYWHIPGKSEDDPIRFLAAYCVCNDCRLANGSVINAWMYTVRENILDGRTLQPVVLDLQSDKGRRPEGLVRYESSPKTFREFCGGCGATVFYYCMDRHGGELLDLALGLLDEEAAGSRAERWCSWRNQVSYAKCANDQQMLEVLLNGIQSL